MERKKLEMYRLAEQVIAEAKKIVDKGHNAQITCEDYTVKLAADRLELKKKLENS